MTSIFSPLPFVIAVPGLLLAVIVDVFQRRTQQPVLPAPSVSLLAVLGANFTQFLVSVSLIIAMVTVPLMAGKVMGKEPFAGALWLLRMTEFIPAGAVLGDSCYQ